MSQFDNSGKQEPKREPTSVASLEMYYKTASELPLEQEAQFKNEFIHELGLRLDDKDAIPYREWITALCVAQRTVRQKAALDGAGDRSGSAAAGPLSDDDGDTGSGK